MPIRSNALLVDGRKNDRHKALQQIADTLRMPVETLIQSGGSDEFPDETAELIRLWFRISDLGKRQAVLEAIRRAAGQTGSR